jgi:hypothetical protein
MKIELNSELENELYKVQIKEIELEGRYLLVRGIVLDVDDKNAFEFEDSIDISDFCRKQCVQQEDDEQEEIQNES